MGVVVVVVVVVELVDVVVVVVVDVVVVVVDVVELVVVVLVVVVSVIVVVVLVVACGVCMVSVFTLPGVPPSCMHSSHWLPLGSFLSRLRPFPLAPMLGVYVSWSITFPFASLSVIVSPSFESP